MMRLSALLLATSLAGAPAPPAKAPAPPPAKLMGSPSLGAAAAELARVEAKKGTTTPAPRPAAAATDGGAPLTRMPTDAECLALSPKLPLSFGPGEVLDYDLDALGAKAGKMTMRVLPPKDGVLPVEVHVETNTFFSKVRKVVGTGTTYLTKTLRPARYLEDAEENDIHRIADVTFQKNKRAKLVSTIDGQVSELELAWGSPDVSDVAGAVFLLRQLPLKEGKTVCFDAYGIRRIWRVWGTVLPREHVSLPVGEFEAWHLAGQAARLDWPDAPPRGLHVWLSDDAKRLPLAALGTIDLGAVRATLIGVTRPGDKATKAENKGNLTW